MITLDNISYRIGSFNLQASLEIRDEDYFVLAGRTGCGKTTLIECICGLKPVAGGRILVDGVDVTTSDPRHRRIGYVPQDCALFEHLDVRGNILFPLKVRRVQRAEMERTLGELSGKLFVGHLLDRAVAGLSGGERQRVALARALASRPKALLLDEPVSALDESSRDKVCRELLNIHREFKVPVIHVCHSSEETSLVASRMAIMCDGRIVQTDTPETMFARPLNAYVARFLRVENVLSGTGLRRGGKSLIHSNGLDIRADAPEGAIEFIVRPWQVDVVESPPTTDAAIRRRGQCTTGEEDNVLEGRIRELSYTGPVARIQMDGPLPLVAQIARRHAETMSLAVGKSVRMSFPVDAVYIMEDKQG